MAHSRIDDLRRRVEADPASIAFAQLAEEYRRAGQTEEAVRVSREGLTRHPGYLSARVTLGRSLLDLGQLDEARTELQFVATEAPENLAAVRGLAEIFHREGDAPSALEYFQRALSLARHDPELEEIVQQLSRQVGAETGPANGLSFEEAHQELLSAADRVPLAPAAATAETTPAATGDPEGATAPFDFDTLVAALGTPAAPPLVEAVVRGETPEVFELPELPDLAGQPVFAGDPFAVLEAELRSQPAGEADPETTEVAPEAGATEPPAESWLTSAYVVEEPAAAAWPAPAADAPEAAEQSAAPDVAVDPEQALDASIAALLAPDDEPADAPPLGTAAVESPETPEAPEEIAASSIVVPETPSGIETTSETPPVVETVSVSVADWLAPLEADAVTPSEALMAEAAPPVSIDAPLPADAVEAPPASDVSETEAAPVAATPAAEPEPAPESAAGSDDRQPAATSRRDDVLGDLEDWLDTLQDRSDQ